MGSGKQEPSFQSEPSGDADQEFAAELLRLATRRAQNRRKRGQLLTDYLVWPKQGPTRPGPEASGAAPPPTGQPGGTNSEAIVRAHRESGGTEIPLQGGRPPQRASRGGSELVLCVATLTPEIGILIHSLRRLRDAGAVTQSEWVSAIEAIDCGRILVPALEDPEADPWKSVFWSAGPQAPADRPYQLDIPRPAPGGGERQRYLDAAVAFAIVSNFEEQAGKSRQLAQHLSILSFLLRNRRKGPFSRPIIEQFLRAYARRPIIRSHLRQLFNAFAEAGFEPRIEPEEELHATLILQARDGSLHKHVWPPNYGR